ncbi:hypothetical protein [Lysinibacillus sp. NPDC056232]|uniref:hypothetical protein n=1 Tax=Lysinibacillus sp. NPDC056232 TaxID=3345756 RepID=UPI0035D56240
MLLPLRFSTDKTFVADVGHEGVITGCDDFSLRSSIADPQGVVQPERRSTYPHDIRFNKMTSNFLV